MCASRRRRILENDRLVLASALPDSWGGFWLPPLGGYIAKLYQLQADRLVALAAAETGVDCGVG